MEIIKKQLTLEYWQENGWFEGRLREIPEVLGQGQTLDELEDHIREDCAALVSDAEYARSRGYAHLDAADIWHASLKLVELDRFQAAVAQLQALSPDRAEKVFAYIEDLVDLEALERRVDEEDSRKARDQGGDPGLDEDQETEW
jgi:predicted RNase H-like HicB family nuclease